MSESMLITVEVIFNVLYLMTVWIFVAFMFVKRGNVLDENKKLSKLFILCFLLLAMGDTGHVGFRVVAYATGGLEANPI